MQQFQACAWIAVVLCLLFSIYGANADACASMTTLSTESGEITDRTTGTNYENNLDCKWLIDFIPADFSPYAQLQLTITEMGTEGGYDVLRIYEGNSTQGRELLAYSGRPTVPKMVATNGTQMFLRWTTDGGRTDVGWSLSWTYSKPYYCLPFTNTSGGSGQVSSQHLFPSYQLNSDCLWLIQPSQEGRVTVDFPTFNTQTGVDIVYLYDGNSTENALIAEFSGNDRASIPTIFSTESSLLLRFVTSSSSVPLSGWTAAWATAQKATFCSGIVSSTAGSGSISDHTNDGFYKANSNCVWQVQPEVTGRYTRTFFALSSLSLDVGDTVSVYNGNSTESPLIQKFSKNSTFPFSLSSNTLYSIVAPSNNLFVHFSSDSSYSKAYGFSAKWLNSAYCYGNEALYSTSGYLRFPRVPEIGNYPDRTNCGWVIVPPFVAGSILQINVISIGSEGCCDIVKVYDGPTIASPMIGQASGSQSNVLITSSFNSSSVLVSFTSDGSITGWGFDLTWTYYTPNSFVQCSGVVSVNNATSGEITDHYGAIGKSNYTNNINCAWQIDVSTTGVAARSRIQLNFVLAGIALGDRLTIYDGLDSTASIIRSFTNTTTIPDLIITTGSQVFITLVSDASVVSTGIYIRWSVIVPATFCNGLNTITSTSGTINDHTETVGPYKGLTDCSWTFSPTNIPADWYTVLTIRTLSLADANDTLTIYDGRTSSAPIMKRFDGVQNTELPLMLIGTSIPLFVQFSTDKDYLANGFTFDYSTSPYCYGMLTYTGLSGTIRNPFKSSGTSYQDRANCQWLIIPSEMGPGATIQITINTFSTEGGLDVLRIYNGNSSTAPLAGSYSGDIKYISYITNGTSLYMTFTSDGSVVRSGFVIDYVVMETDAVVQCSGETVYTNTTGTIQDHSGRLVSHYNQNSSCGYLIDISNTASIGNRVLISFRYFNLANSSYLRVHDGDSASSPVIISVTGSTIPADVASTGSMIYISFGSSIETDLGFRLVWSTITGNPSFCNGITRLTSNSASISDHTGGYYYKSFADCTWIIQPTNFPALSYTMVHISNLVLLPGDKVTIYEGNTTNGPVLDVLSGKVESKRILTSGTNALVHYETDASLTTVGGFSMNYVTGPYCWGVKTLGAPFGTVRNPLVDGVYYLDSSSCYWNIIPPEPPAGSFIQLRLRALNTEQCCDRLIIYDGPNSTFPEIGRYSGNSNELIITASGPSASLFFGSDGSSVGLGFLLDYTLFTSNSTEQCNGRVVVNNETLGSVQDHQGALGASNYTDNALCQWELVAPNENQRMQIQFVLFDLALNDSVIIYDGNDTSAPIIQHFSGSVVPPIIVPSQRSVLVHFETDNSTVATGFYYKYQAVAAGSYCSGHTGLSAASGVISDHSSANGFYKGSSDCSWLISPSVGGVVTPDSYTALLISTLDLADEEDVVTIYDGLSANDPVLARFAGPQATIPYIYSTGIPMFITFSSNKDYAGRGFSAQYFTSPYCQGTLEMNATSGAITNPPKNGSSYQADARCTWIIDVTNTAPVGSRIQLTLTSFNTEQGIDILRVYDGTTSAASQLAAFSGNNIAGAFVVSTGRAMYLQFTSNSYNQLNGFTVEWRVYAPGESVQCSGNATLLGRNSGTIVDHFGILGASNYTNNVTCGWLIDVSSINLKGRVQLTFSLFDLVDSDSLTIYDGSSPASPLIASFNGKTLPSITSSTSSTIFLSFQTNGNGVSLGFAVGFTVMSPGQFCFGRTLLTDTSRAIRDHLGGGNYANNADCSWEINPPLSYTLPAGSTTVLTLTEFTLLPNDILTIYDGNSAQANVLRTITSPVTLPLDVVTSGVQAFIRYTSDSALTAAGGFAISYLSSPHCHGTVDFNSPLGSLQMPIGQSVDYQNNANCLWVIQPPNVDPSYLIQIKLTSIATERNFDFLRFFDGNSTTSPLINSFHGSSNNVTFITSSSPSITLQFISDGSNTNRGFSLEWQLVTSNTTEQCSGEQNKNSTAGILQDHTGPVGASNYTNNANCGWAIVPASISTGRLQLEFYIFSLSDNDTVTIHDGSTATSPIIKVLSGTSKPDNIITSGPAAYVGFSSNEAGVSTGFYLQWTVVQPATFCSGLATIVVPSGTFYDHTGSGVYKSQTNCAWLINPPLVGDVIPTSYTGVTLESLNLANKGDTVTIYDGSSESATVLAHFDGAHATPIYVFASSVNMFIRFSTDYDFSSAGIAVSWSTGPYCYGVRRINTTSGFVSNPVKSYTHYQNSANCGWLINPVAAAGSRLQLTISSFVTESNSDTLVAYDGNSTLAPVLGVYSGRLSKITFITASSTSMYLTFISDATNVNAGFTSTFQVYEPEVHSQCSGTKAYNAASGTIQDHTGLVGYTNYTANTVCGWQINVAAQRRVQITFNAFDLHASDTLTFYSGTSASGPIIAQYSGTSIPPAITTSIGNTMFIQLRTGSNGTATGFHLSWNTIGEAGYCTGPLSSYAATGTIQDPFNGGNYKGESNCSWYISASGKPSGSYVVLTATSFSLAAGDYLAIYDGSSSAAPMVANLTGALPVPYNIYASGIDTFVNFVSDSDYSSTGFALSWTTSAYCQGISTYNTLSGSFTNPPTFLSRYQPSASCSWVISPAGAEPGAVLQIIISHLDTQKDIDVVTIYDGPATSYNVLGRFSGQNSNYSFVTATGSTAMLTFNSDAYIEYTGFTVSWQLYNPSMMVVNPSNGTVLTLAQSVSGLLRTDYGHPVGTTFYNASSTYSWLIDVSGNKRSYIAGSRVELSVRYFNLGQGDSLTLFDGDSEMSPIITSFSAVSYPTKIYSSGGRMFVQLRSDSENQGKGIYAEYSTVERGTVYCSGLVNLTANSGTFSDHYGNGNYRSNSSCSWLAVPSNPISDSVTYLSFSSIDLYPGDSEDIITVYDGSNTLAPTILRISGQQAAGLLFTLSSLSFVVTFETGFGNTAKGFTANYITTPYCMGTVVHSALSGVISNPPRNVPTYQDGANCAWLIQPAGASAGSKIQLTISSLSTEVNFDFLSIYDGVNASATLLRRISGSITQRTYIIGSSPNAFLTFTSDGSIVSAGFRLTWKVYDTGYVHQCSGVQTITNATGYMQDHDGLVGYSNYTNNANCGWSFYSDLGRVQLSFFRFNLGAGDYLSVYDGPSDSSDLIGVYSGSTLPATISSTRDYLFVRFTSDGENPATGFEFSWESLPPSLYCSRSTTLTESSGTISDHSSGGNYQNNANCSWVISPPYSALLPLGSNTRLTFSLLQIAANDFLTIYDGNTTNAPVLAVFTNYTSLDHLPIVYASSLSVFLHFTSDSVYALPGFKFSWDSSSYCNGIVPFTTNNGTLELPPKTLPSYQPYAKCGWSISPTNAPADHIIQITIVSFVTEEGPDFLDIYNGASNASVLLRRNTGTLQNYTFVTTSGPNAFLYFQSNSINQKSGFTLTWQLYAPRESMVPTENVTLSTTSGIIQDHYGPVGHSNYTNNVQVGWGIDMTSFTAVGRVKLVFPFFDLDFGDYVIIYDGPTENSPEILRLTGSYGNSNAKRGVHNLRDAAQAPDVIATSNNAYMVFTTDESGTAGGFFASYSAADSSEFCSGVTVINRTSATGAITDHTNGGYYQSNSNCGWFFTAPINAPNNTRTILSFTRLDLSSGDRITVYDGSSTLGTLLANISSGDTYANLGDIISSGPNMFVQFTTDESLAGLGFEAVWAIAEFCSGTVTLMGNTGSLTYPPAQISVYQPLAQCGWIIRPLNPPPLSRMEVTVNFLKTEAGEDFLNVYDGTNNANVQRRSFSGTQTGPVMLSTDTAFLEFLSDNSIQGTGFIVSWRLAVYGCDGGFDSGVVLDVCGRCGGNGNCTGCDGVAYSNKTLDSCGKCGGNNSTCTGCDGVVNSGVQKDRCGVCNGDNACISGCDRNPNSTLVFDVCGVCGGNNITCTGVNALDVTPYVYHDPSAHTGAQQGCGCGDGLFLQPVAISLNSSFLEPEKLVVVYANVPLNVSTSLCRVSGIVFQAAAYSTGRVSCPALQGTSDTAIEFSMDNGNSFYVLPPIPPLSGGSSGVVGNQVYDNSTFLFGWPVSSCQHVDVTIILVKGQDKTRVAREYRLTNIANTGSVTVSIPDDEMVMAVRVAPSVGTTCPVISTIIDNSCNWRYCGDRRLCVGQPKGYYLEPLNMIDALCRDQDVCYDSGTARSKCDSDFVRDVTDANNNNCRFSSCHNALVYGRPRWSWYNRHYFIYIIYVYWPPYWWWSYVWGDPHFSTFDGCGFSFMGVGDFVLSGVNDTLGTTADIITRYRPTASGGGITFTSAVMINVSTPDDHSSVQISANGLYASLMVDDSFIFLPVARKVHTVKFKHGTIAINYKSGTFSVTLSNGIQVSIVANWQTNRLSRVDVGIPSELMPNAYGLLGRRGSRQFISPSGEVVQTCNDITASKSFDFGYSWEVQPAMVSSCDLDICTKPARPDNSPRPPSTPEAVDACGGLTGFQRQACEHDYDAMNDTAAVTPSKGIDSNINLSNVTINITATSDSNIITAIWNTDQTYSSYLHVLQYSTSGQQNWVGLTTFTNPASTSVTNGLYEFRIGVESNGGTSPWQYSNIVAVNITAVPEVNSTAPIVVSTTGNTGVISTTDGSATTSPSTTQAGSSTQGQTTAGQATGQTTVSTTNEQTGSQSTGNTGQTTAGQTTAGQTTAGQTTAGQTTAGQTTDEQTTAGQTTAGQTTAGQTTTGQTTVGQTTSEANTGQSTSQATASQSTNGGQTTGGQSTNSGQSTTSQSTTEQTTNGGQSTNSGQTTNGGQSTTNSQSTNGGQSTTNGDQSTNGGQATNSGQSTTNAQSTSGQSTTEQTNSGQSTTSQNSGQSTDGGQSTTSASGQPGSTTGVVTSPPGVPTNLVINPRRIDAHVTWNVPQDGGSVASYEVQLQNSTNTLTYTTSTTAISLTFLAPNSTYLVLVEARNAIGASPSASNSFTTKPLSVPEKAPAPISRRYSRDSIQVTCLSPEDNGGLPILGYTIFNSSDSVVWMNATIAEYMWYYGLTQSTTYYFRAAAYNSLGWGPVSEIGALSTAAAMCGDGVCDAGESCSDCYLDCGACELSCPGSPECNGKGTCNLGTCSCNSGSHGPDCSLSDVLPITVVANYTSPNIEVRTPAQSGNNGNSVTFGLSILDIDEIQSDEGIVVSYSLGLQNFTLEGHPGTLPDGSIVTYYTYSTVLPNSANITIVFTQFTDATTVYFADHAIQIGENGLKYAVSVAQWPFVNIRNKLRIHMSTVATSSDKLVGCTTTSVGDDGAENMRWMKVSLNGVSLYGQFPDFALVDSEVKSVQFRYLKDAAVVTVTIPHFWSVAAFDPNYQVLIDPHGEETGYQTGQCDSLINTTSKNSVPIGAIGGAVAGVVFIAAAVAAVMFVRSRNAKQQRLKRLTTRSTTTLVPQKQEATTFEPLSAGNATSSSPLYNDNTKSNPMYNQNAI